MLRLVLLVLYLAASFSISAQNKQGAGWNPPGLNAPPPTGDAGGGWDPDGLNVRTPPPAEIGGGWDPNG